MRRLCCIITGFIILITAVAPACARQRLRWVYIEFPPAYFTSAKGMPEGDLADIAIRIMEKAGYDWEAAAYPTRRMIRAMTQGEADVWFGLPNIPGFEENVLAGESEIYKASMCTYTMGEKPPVLQKTDLGDRSVILLRGYGYSGWADYIKSPENGITFHEVNDDGDDVPFRMLKIGRADYLLHYKEPSEKILKKKPCPGLRCNVISTVISHIVVSAKTPDAPEILKQLEEAWQSIQREAGAAR